MKKYIGSKNYEKKMEEYFEIKNSNVKRGRPKELK